jgi:uncharacterized protein YsxB (DUF464 family)
MVRISVRQRGDTRCLVMAGHAGYNTGNDIVCAGCSALAYALMGWMENAPERVTRRVCDLGDGELRLSGSGDDCFAAAFDMTVIGLAQIARKYPENALIEWL